MTAHNTQLSALIGFEKVGQLISQLERWTVLWHQHSPELPGEAQSFRDLVQTLHACNFLLWHEEDEVRRRDVPDAVIVGHKRAIDRWNQQRNDTIEQADAHLLATLHGAGVRPRPDAPLHSETPGSILDRLSILSLKIYHMGEQTRRSDVGPEHIATCSARLAVLREQRDDLSACLERLLAELVAGRTWFKLYRQFKMYNDPALNPALARSAAEGSRTLHRQP